MASKSINRIFASLNQLPNPPPPPPSLRLRCAINYGENEELWDKNFVGKTMSTLINNSNPWSNGVESSLAELCPVLSEATVIQTLNLIKSSDDASEFFRWTQRMGFPPTEYSFFTMLEILGRSRDLIEARKLLFSIEKISGGSVKLVDRFFNSLIRSYGRAGMFQESINLFNSMKSLGVSPSVVTFNGLFSILLKRGRPAEALKLFDEMLGTYGVTPDTFTFNVLIRGFSLNGMAGEGFRFFKEMGRLRCEPDVITYNSLVDGLCRAGKMGVARNVIKGMEKKSPDLKPNVVTYTTLIRGYCMRREVDAALLIFNEMTGQGLVPNDVTYNTLLKGLCEANRHEEIKEVLEGATRRGEFVPDTCTFNTLIHSHCVSGNLDEALKAFSKMSELKVQQDSATYSVLIRTLCQRGDYRKAEELFDELSEKEILLGDSGCKPLVASYNPIFKHLCSAGKSKKAERVFRQLMRRGTQDPKSYKTLIMGHCREGQFRAGFELLSLMLKREFDPDPEIFVSLIDGMLKTGNPLLAKVILENMVQRQHRPSRSTFHSILTELLNRGLAKQSASLITLMLKKRVVQNITISTRLMVLLFGSGEAGTAFEIMGLLYENGYIVNIEELVGFLCQKNMLLEACKVLRFGFPNHHSIDCELFNIVIAGLSKQGKAYEAFGLYYDLVENEVNDQLTCLEDLKRGLKAEGKIAEAMFVSNRKSIEQHRTSDQKNKEVKDSAAWFKLPRDGNSKVTRPTSSTQKKPTCNKQSNSLFT